MQETTITVDSGIHTRLRWFISDTLAVARRSAAHIRQTPEKLLDVTMQPLMFVLLFAFVFGGAIHVAGGSYREYLVGGILVQTIFFGMMGPAISIATDLKEGVLERFRSLPMSRSAYLFGHLTAEFSAMLLAVVIMTISGLIVGWGINASIAQRPRGLRIAPAACRPGDLGRHPAGYRGALAGCGDGTGVHRHLPSHLRLERLRRDAGRCPTGCGRSRSGTRSAPWRPPCGLCSATRQPCRATPSGRSRIRCWRRSSGVSAPWRW